MQTLTPPAQTVLQVMDKVVEDQQLNAGSVLLYMRLLLLAGKDGGCGASQTLLAKACKSSVRAVQGYITKLVERGYIQIERNGTRNVYQLRPSL